MAKRRDLNTIRRSSDIPPTMLKPSQDLLQAPLMNREAGSNSSFNSMGSSRGSFHDPGSYTPLTSCVGSPISHHEFPQYLNPPVPLPNSFLDPEGSPSFVQGEFVPRNNAELPLFNIEKDGDPRISWIMYYDFVVTKAEAYYQLRPDYLPTEKFPPRIQRQKAKGNKEHSCGVLNCSAKPFTRHYDLERHFRTVHQGNTSEDTFYCDYSKCEHKDPLRKDHCREHYREYHTEDLLKRGEQNINAFLSSRVGYVKRQWWRCGRCLKRVKTNVNGWDCPDCGVSCEPERQEWRNKVLANETYDEDENIASEQYIIGCGICENAWLPDLNDPTGQLWVPCPSCQPGPPKTMQ